MNKQGIYTLANDVVYDQLVALINSIEVNISPDMPICIIPYDNRIDRIKQEVDFRPNVTLFEDTNSLQRWEDFARDVWATHPQNNPKKATVIQTRIKSQRRYAAFDGLFDQFVVYDADCLAMKPLTDVFEKLETYDFVFDDWEHTKPESVAALKLSLIEKSGQFKAEYLRTRLHCCSFFGSKRGLFDESKLSELKKRLIENREIEWINGLFEAFLFTYMTLRGNYSLFNFTRSSDSQDRTGNCADADPFVNINNILYNEQGLKPIHRIHYMNYLSLIHI